MTPFPVPEEQELQTNPERANWPMEQGKQSATDVAGGKLAVLAGHEMQPIEDPAGAYFPATHNRNPDAPCMAEYPEPSAHKPVAAPTIPVQPMPPFTGSYPAGVST